MPDNLSAVALSEYKRVRERLESEGRWSQAASGMVTAYAEAWAEYRRLTDEIDKAGGPVVKDSQGKLFDHPASRQQRHAIAKVQKLAKALRLTETSPIRRGAENAALDAGDLSGGILGAIGRHLLRIERMQDSRGLSPGDLRHLSEARSETLAQQTRLGGVEATAAAEIVDMLEARLPKSGPSRKVLREVVHAAALAMTAGGKVALVGPGTPASDMLAGVLIPTLEGRKLRAQAEKEEAARDAAVGRLVRRDEVEQGWEYHNTQLKQTLERLPEIARLECEHMTATEIIDWFDQAIYDALAAMAKRAPGIPDD